MMARPIEAVSPIFIGGQRRSGTSLFRVLLNRHPHIACGPETKVLQDPGLEMWNDRLAAEWEERIQRHGFDATIIDRCMASLIDQLFGTYSGREGKRRWAEKSPGNILRIDYLLRLFPAAQFVHVIRDPRDTYCSIRQRALRDKPEWSKFHPSRSARDWREAILAGRPWTQHPDRYHEVRYEELVSDPDGCMRRVMDFLGETWDARLLDARADNAEARRDEQVHRDAILGGSVGRWRSELDTSALKKIERVAGDLMSELGYKLTVIPPRLRT